MPDTAGNSLATATSLNLTSASQSFPDLVTPVANDYYRFVLSAPSSLNLSLTGLDANANVELLDGSGNLVSVDGVPQRSANSSTFSEAINTTLNPGLYYIRVSPDVTVSQANYTLNVTAQDNLLSTDLLWRYSPGLTVYWDLDQTVLVTGGALSADRSANWTVGGLGDFNQDGNTDILWRDASAALTDVWFMNGATLLSSSSIFPALGADWQISGTADFNQDGKTDIIWRNPTAALTDIWFMNGTTLLSSTTLTDQVGIGWEIGAVGDFNRDGNPDLLWYNRGASILGFWLLDSALSVQAVVPLPSPDIFWILSGTGDFNRDGNLDLLWRYLGPEGTVAGWLLDRTTPVSAFLLPSVPDPLLSVYSPLNTYGTPNPIDLAGNSSATAFNLGQNVLGSATYRDRVDGLTDSDDYYQFSITNTARVSLSLAGLGADLDLQLFNNRGQEIGFSSQVGNSSESIISQLDAGTYYIRVLPFSANDSSTYALSINVNTPPVLVTNNVLTLSEQGTASLSNAVLRVTDADNLPTEVVYTVSELPLNGTLFVGGVAVVAGSTFTEADVDAGNRIQYVHNGSETTSDRFTFSVTDNAGGAIGLTTFSFAVTPVNDPPSIVSNLGLTVSEGAQGSINAALLQLTDVDSPLAGLTYSITALPTNGTLLLGGTTVTSFTQADLASGNLSYRHNGGETTSDRFTFVASDGAGAALTSTFSITVLAVNDPPVLVLPTGTQAVDQQTNTLLSGISVTDVDLGTGEYTVTVSAGNGVLTLGRTSGITFLSGDGTQDSSFSFRGPQAVTNFVLQSLIYRSNNGFRGSDTVNITVSDGGNTGLGGPLSASGIISLSVAPVNDAPVLTAPTAQTVLEDVTTPISGIVVGDLDSGSGLLEVSLTAANGTLSLNSTSGINLTTGTGNRDRNLVFTGSLDAVNAVLAGLTYQGDRNFNGADQLRISVSDRLNGTNGIPLSDTKIVSLTVTAVNDAPILTVPGAQQVNENSDLRVTGINVTDVDATGDLTVNLFASSGRLSLSSTAGLTFDAGNGTQNEILSFRGAQAAVNDALRTLLYRANTDFNGSDTITLNVTDGGGTGIGGVLGDSKTIAVNVVGINNPPAIAVPSTPLAVDSDTNLAINGVRITDPDANGGILSVTLLAQNGVLSLSNTAGLTFTQGNGNQNNRLTFTGTLFAINTALSTITYRSYPGFTNAFDRITLQVNDNGNTGIGIPLSDAKTLLVNVGGAVNRPPVASNDAFSVAENAPLNGGTVLANDNDPDFTLPLTAQLVASPANALSFTLNPNGTFSYTPTLNYNGVDTFTYRAIDALGGASNTATVAITVTPVNNAPVALSDGPYTIAAGGTLTVTGAGVLSNDTDVDTPLANLTASLVTAPGNGTLSLNPNGSFTYRPTGSFAGIDRFTYVASDGSLTSNLATVTISVGANNAPIANPDNFTLGQNGTLTTGSVLTNDTDADNNLPLSATLAIAPTNALSFTLNPDGTFRYQPRTNFIGTDTFVYRAIDRLGAISSNSATVTFNVTAVNQAPIAVNDTRTVTVGIPLTVTAPGILVNDTDFENSPLTATLVATTNNGTLSLNPNGSFVYTPNAGFTGTDIFTYRANDGSLSSTNTATVSLLVGAAPNQLPIANPDSFTTPENTSLTLSNVLTNDTDPDGSLPLTASLVVGPANALSFTLNPDGTFRYQPRTNFSGVDSFVYRAIDSLGAISSAGATVTINVTSVTNTAPVVLNDNYTVATTASLAITAPGVLANDTDAEGSPLTATLVATTPNGTLSLNPNGAFVYQPNAGFTGIDSFTYRANDGSLNSPNVGTANITVSISGTNAAPIANPDIFTTQRNTSLTTGSVLTNDTDPEGSPLTASVIAAPANALSFTLNPSGTFNYLPTLNFVGADTFTYVAVDALGARSQTATVTFSVTGSNTAPVANNETFSVLPAGTLNITLPGVLANDTDAENNPLTATLIAAPSNAATFTLNANGSFTYIPQTGFSGSDRFTYVANDGTANSNTATVTISVSTNQIPIAVSDSFTVPFNTSFTVGNVLSNDTDPDNNVPLTASVVAAPTNALSFTLRPDGGFSYVPNLNFSGTDTFTYVAIDSLGGTSNPTTATFSVTPGNRPPLVSNDTVAVNSGSSLTITAPGVLRNDTDPDGNALTASISANATRGTVALNSDGSFVYTPNPGFFGTDSFTYLANDGTVNSTPATVTIRVNAPPVAVSDTYTAAIGGPLNVASLQGVLANDTDPDGPGLTASVLTGPAQGTLALNPNGSFIYTSNTGASGVDTFTYVATDGLASSTATVTLSLRTNNAPIAVNDSYRVATNGTLNVQPVNRILGNDSDPDAGTVLSATLVTEPTRGSLSLNPNGTFTYVPQTGFQGTDSFVYRASDGITLSNPATVTLSVSNNAPPVANNDTFTAFSGIPRNQFAPGVRANDTDANGDNLTIFLVSQPINGTVNLSSSGAFVYTANSTFQGVDTFVYRAFDGIDSSTATVTMSVTQNLPPVALPDVFGAIAGQTLTITAPGVLANDTDPENDPLSAIGNAIPTANGRVLSFNGDGSFTYLPNPGFAGVDSFTYVASDGISQSLATITINVAATNTPPVANPDNYRVNPNNVLIVPRTLGVLANDSDPNTGQQLSASVVTNPTQGVLSLNPNGSFVYTPNATAVGTDSFTYLASDGSLSSTAGVTITINTTSTPPTAQNDNFTVATNGTLTITAAGVLANDSDSNGDVIRSTLATNPGNGSVTLNPDGSFVYRPNASFQGTDSFTYLATDGLTNSTPATVFVTVGGANAAPVVSVPGSQLISQNSTLTIASGLSVNDPDAGSSPIQVTLSATNGTLTLGSLTGLTFTTGTGTANPLIVFTGAIANVNAALANLQLTPTAGFTGASQITLIANDQGANGTGGPQTGSGTVTVNVTNGATLVTNISPGASNSDPTNLVSVGNRVYFAATDGSTGVELWRSDGTAAATTRVADIDPGSAASTPTSLTVVGNFLYYTANTSTAGVELWRTDLTTGTGATLVRDIRPGIDSSLPQNLVNYANNLFFVATDGTGGLRQLWRVDSTGAAVKVLAGVNNVTNLTIAGSTLYFTAGGGTQLWRVDSPTATPVLVRNVGTGAAISNLTAVGDRLFFTARDTAGVELWSSDGTTANTNRVTDLNAGAADANPRSLVAFNGNLYFFAQDSAGGAFKLFQSTPTGVVSAIATLPSTGTAPAQLTVVGSRLFFVADAGTVANPNLQLWTSDGGTTASLVRDVNAAGSDQISSLTSFNGSLFFVANDGTGYRIFRSDGSAANTVAVSGTFTTPPNNLTVAGDRLLFSASDATNGSELWTVG